MELEIEVVDAFTDKVFGGNPAAVIITTDWLNDTLMQQIAAENNLSETAFLVETGNNTYEIRWFSPLSEIDFCGHASLASADVIFRKQPSTNQLTFYAKAVGTFVIENGDDGKLIMNFPNTYPQPIDEIPADLLDGLSIKPSEVLQNKQAYFVIYESEHDVLNLERDNETIKRLAPYDVVATCKSETDQHDFVSRYFWPANGGDEDPVTGSIHTGLAPLWAKRLNKTELVAFQASKRGGKLYCKVDGERVLISGYTAPYLKGVVTV